MSIEVRNISKTFASFKALDDVSLKVNSGELVALLGPSGSGKTTLLRVLAGLEHPDAGSGPILFHDDDVGQRGARERGVGFVFQHYALFRHMSVFENVAFGLRVRPRRLRPPQRQIRQRVHELLELVQLGSFANRYPHQLSGGQRQRIALARALAVKPGVLLLDEPFGALDARVRKELRDWLRRLHEEIHVTSVLVTHDQDEALAVADRVAVLHQGRIEQVGTPDEVFHHPRTRFVMEFLGEVNALAGKVDHGLVRFDTLAMPFPTEHQQVGGETRLFVRPHDVTIDTKTNGLPSVPARVVRVHSAGPVVRVTLQTEGGQSLAAELSQERFASMNLAVGREVYIRPRHIRVFAAD